jgi:putative ABC transport system ATP-binding protein
MVAALSQSDGLLVLESVSKTYDAGQPVRALDSTSLSIYGGEFITVTGASGSGKSTLLNLLGLLEVPSTGSYWIEGVETSGLDEPSRGAIRGQLFGFVFQAFHLLPGHTVLENVELGMLYGPLGRRERRGRALEAIDRVGLTPRAHALPRTLSGGERQRVAIARAVAARPRVLLCDEPTGNLDSVNGENIIALLREFHADHLTIVVVTHDPVVAANGERTFRVKDGVVDP